MIDNIKLALASIKADLGDTWKRVKIVLLAIVAVIVAIEFGKIKEFLIAYMGRKELEKSNTKDDGLKTQETTLNDTANKLVADASSLPAEQKPVDLEWNKKK